MSAEPTPAETVSAVPPADADLATLLRLRSAARAERARRAARHPSLRLRSSTPEVHPAPGAARRDP